MFRCKRMPVSYFRSKKVECILFVWECKYLSMISDWHTAYFPIHISDTNNDPRRFFCFGFGSKQFTLYELLLISYS